MTMGRGLEILGVEGIGEIAPGDRLPAIIGDALEASSQALQDGDVLVVSQKVVSKAEGCLWMAKDVEPSPLARRLVEGTDKTPQHMEIILRNTKSIVKMHRQRAIYIVETPHGLICANGGVDRSNISRQEGYSGLPEDPDGSAAQVREELERRFGKRIGVIISDSFGRPWRVGQIDVAIGLAGFAPLKDYRGGTDDYGYELKGTLIAVADEIASAAELVKGKVDRVPVVIVRGLDLDFGEWSSRELIRSPDEDLFR